MRSETIHPGKVAAFLADLTALTQKHGIEIDGCGCCGSPYLWATDELGEYYIRGYNREDDRTWNSLEYVRPGEREAQLVSPSFRPIANPVLLEPGESLSDAVAKATDGDVIYVLPGYSGEIVSEAQP